MKSIFLIALAFSTFASSGLFAHFYHRNDDLSLRYVLWKEGVHPYPAEIIAHAVLADRNRDELIRGKTKQEVKALFPDVSESNEEYQKNYEKELAGRDYLWLGRGGGVIFFVNGKGEKISIMKG